MNHISFSKTLLLPAFCLLLLLDNVRSQTTGPVLSAGFSNELGLDFAPFLRGQRGISLIYKHKLGPMKAGKWQKQGALRLVGGGYKESTGAFNIFYPRGDTAFVVSGSGDDDSKSYFVSLGYERQYDRKKCRFYFGGEMGYRGGSYNSSQRTEATVNGMTFSYDATQREVRTNGPEAAAFGGINYFFLPHFSIGLEANLAYGIEFANSHRIRNGGTVFTDKSTTFVGTIDLLHLLYLSYHF